MGRLLARRVDLRARRRDRRRSLGLPPLLASPAALRRLALRARRSGARCGSGGGGSGGGGGGCGGSGGGGCVGLRRVVEMLLYVAHIPEADA
jgi:hypothetical protein